jgi:hypothetical protein
MAMPTRPSVNDVWHFSSLVPSFFFSIQHAGSVQVSFLPTVAPASLSDRRFRQTANSVQPEQAALVLSVLKINVLAISAVLGVSDISKADLDRTCTDVAGMARGQLSNNPHSRAHELFAEC